MGIAIDKPLSLPIITRRFPEKIALAGAGIYQVKSGTSSWNFFLTYGDDPRDTYMISLGYGIHRLNVIKKQIKFIKKHFRKKKVKKV